MRTGSSRALVWAREATGAYGKTQPDGTCLIALTQGALSAACGWSASSGTIGTYLNALGPAVLRRRGGIVVDLAALADLEQSRVEASVLPARTHEVAKLLALQLGRPGPHGTELVRATATSTRPATVADMAATLALSASTVSRHLARLREAGRIRRRGRCWVFPPVAAGEPALAGPIRPEVRAVLDEAARYIDLAGGALGEAHAFLAYVQPLAEQAPLVALAQRLWSLYQTTEALLAELGHTSDGRLLIDWGVEPELLGARR